MADEELKKKVIPVPELPNIVQGDGRYLMSLLKSYLETASQQINLANGFTAEEINSNNSSKVPTPNNFTLTFNRLGAVFNWDYPQDITSVAYYELRTDKNIGLSFGLLERTINNTSIKTSIYYSDTIYLFAVNKDGDCSNATQITYTKPRPDAPKDIALTKNNEGTLITFFEIPTNCIGAHIYINGEMQETVDNIFLYKHESSFAIKNVTIAYYDIFGEGERAIINCVIQNVTGFYVEKNGANLYFYWEPVDIYGAKYIVKVAKTLDWSAGIEIFSTKLNKHRYIYPNAGDFYFMVKAVDEHNNYSPVAAWYLMCTTNEIEKNIILNFDQSSVAYSGNKINMYYSAVDNGIKLESGFFYGEYLIDIQLNKRYRARSWCEFKVIGKSAGLELMFDDCDFLVDSEKCRKLYLNGYESELGDVVITKQIARYTGKQSTDLFNAELNNSVTKISGGTNSETIHADDFRNCRWNKGLFIDSLTKLSYNLSTSIGNNFSLSFWFKTIEELKDCIILTLRNTGEVYFLCVGYDARNKCFYLTDNNDKRTTVSLPVTDRNYLFLAISQTTSSRKLYVFSFNEQKTYYQTNDYAPIGAFNLLCLYPKI